MSRKRDSVVVGQSPTCGGDGTSDNKTLPEYPRDPHAMQGAACCMRVWCLDAAGRACGAGPAAAETTAGLAGMHCGMWKRLRLMRCVLRTIRNDAHPRTFRTLADLDYRDTPRLDCRDAPPRMLWLVTCASATLMCLCLCFCLLYALERLLARVGHLAWACAAPMCVRGPMRMGMCVRARVRRQHLFV